MTKVLVRVHPLYLMNVVQTECLVPNCLALSTKRDTTMSIHHHICYYYSAHKPILSLPSHRGGRPRRQLPGSSTPQATERHYGKINMLLYDTFTCTHTMT